MSKKLFFVLSPFVVVALFMSCDLFGTREPAEYIGTWTATASTAAGPAPITMVFDKKTFSVTFVAPVPSGPVEYVIAGDLAKSTTDGELDITITDISENGTAKDGPTREAFLAAYALTADQTFTYTVIGDSMTIGGELLLALTGATSITATAA